MNSAFKMSVLLKTSFKLNFFEYVIIAKKAHVFKCDMSSASPKLDELIKESQDDTHTQKRDQDVDQVRDKSRLKPNHHNVLFHSMPYSHPVTETHLTVKYNRRMFGRYGSESGVNPGIMWPTKGDLEHIREYEKVAFPFTIKEMVAEARKVIEKKELMHKQQHDRVLANLAKLDSWKKELRDKLAKKEADALAVRQKKDKLVEEVRRHFGFTVSTKDEKFKEMLALKEKEQKKKDRQAKQEAKEKKAIAHMLSESEKQLSDTNKLESGSK